MPAARGETLSPNVVQPRDIADFFDESRDEKKQGVNASSNRHGE